MPYKMDNEILAQMLHETAELVRRGEVRVTQVDIQYQHVTCSSWDCPVLHRFNTGFQTVQITLEGNPQDLRQYVEIHHQRLLR